jgi:MoaA/NifB/PqqE/SkfB family radical SAM enzyme
MNVQQIAFHLTGRCQLDCKHWLPDPGQKPLDLALDVIVQILDQARAIYGIEHVSLTGGEPTLHPQFVEVIDAIAAHTGVAFVHKPITPALLSRRVRQILDDDEVSTRIQLPPKAGN